MTDLVGVMEKYPLTLLTQSGEEKAIPLRFNSGVHSLVVSSNILTTKHIIDVEYGIEGGDLIAPFNLKESMVFPKQVGPTGEWIQCIYIGRSIARKGGAHYVAQLSDRGNRLLVYVTRHVFHSSECKGTVIPSTYLNPHNQIHEANEFLQSFIKDYLPTRPRLHYLIDYCDRPWENLI